MVTNASQIRLSATQRQVVEFGDGPLLVVAGPGQAKLVSLRSVFAVSFR